MKVIQFDSILSREIKLTSMNCHLNIKGTKLFWANLATSLALTIQESL